MEEKQDDFDVFYGATALGTAVLRANNEKAEEWIQKNLPKRKTMWKWALVSASNIEGVIKNIQKDGLTV